MKRKTALIAAALSLAAHLVAAQDETEIPSRTIFKISPQHFIDNSLKAGIERFNRKYTASTAFFLTAAIEKNSDAYYSESSYNGVAGEFQLRKYVSPLKEVTGKHGRNFFQGVYGAAYLQGGYYSDSFSGETERYDPLTGMYNTERYDYQEIVRNGGFGFTIGYQKSLWQVVFLEAFLGGGLKFSWTDFEGSAIAPGYNDHSSITDPDFAGILPKIGIHIGIGL